CNADQSVLPCHHARESPVTAAAYRERSSSSRLKSLDSRRGSESSVCARDREPGAAIGDRTSGTLTRDARAGPRTLRKTCCGCAGCAEIAARTEARHSYEPSDYRGRFLWSFFRTSLSRA